MFGMRFVALHYHNTGTSMEEAKLLFDQLTIQNLTGRDFYESYLELKKLDSHLGSLIIGRIRRWLGKYDVITKEELDELTKKSSRLSDGQLASLFQAINKIPESFIPHFRQAIIFSKSKTSHSQISLPTPLSHATALMIHAVVHPEIKGLIARILSVSESDDRVDPDMRSKLWKRVMDEMNRLSSQFQNSYSEQYPVLWGINPRSFSLISSHLLTS
jgi:hypothetical protein